MKTLRFLLAVFLFAAFSFAQDVKKDDWFRVKSDDGEFSIEVPATYGYFYDKEGTSVGGFSGDYEVSEMSIFNSYIAHTLISFESYKGSKNALNAIQDSSESVMSGEKISHKRSEIKKDDYKIKQVISKNDKHYTVRQYFYSKKHIYILIASSRLGETSAMKRFFESLTFKPIADNNLLTKETRFPDLKPTQIEYEEAVENPTKDEKTPIPIIKTKPDPTSKPFIMLNMPRVSYKKSGLIRLKATFSEFGQITKIVLLEKIDKYSLRDSAIAALRIKFLPQEKDDKPINVSKAMEYRFTIY